MKTKKNRIAPARAARGRPKGGQLRVYGSQAAACAALGLDPGIVRAAVRVGAPGCRSGRIYPGELLPWLRRHEHELNVQPGDHELRDRKLAEEIRKLRLANERTEHRLVSRVEVVETLERITARLTRDLEQKLTSEYPSAVASMDVASARIFGRRLFDEILAAMHRCGEEWKS